MKTKPRKYEKLEKLIIGNEIEAVKTPQWGKGQELLNFAVKVSGTLEKN